MCQHFTYIILIWSLQLRRESQERLNSLFRDSQVVKLEKHSCHARINKGPLRASLVLSGRRRQALEPTTPMLAPPPDLGVHGSFPADSCQLVGTCWLLFLGKLPHLFGLLFSQLHMGVIITDQGVYDWGKEEPV